MKTANCPDSMGLCVEIDHPQRVLLDKLAARFHHIAHQGREQVLGLFGLGNPDLQQ